MIPMNDFKAEPEALRQQQLTAAERVFRSGWYVLGKEVQAFEAAWASTCGSPHAVGVGNGMDALEIGLRALQIGPGDEVITTPMTAFASTLAILRAGATPVFADIDPDTAQLDPASVRRCLSPRTRALLLVHLYGHIDRMDEWSELCRACGITLIEDAAQAHLASWQGVRAGAFGAFGAFSFYPTKNLGAIGDAGALISADAALIERARKLRNYGQSERYHHPEEGLNSRLDELQAALLSARLSWLAGFTARRREIALAYHAGIDGAQVRPLPPPQSADNHVYHLFTVRCSRRAELASFLQSKQIASLIHYPVPMHRQPPCVGLPRDPQGLVQAERHAETVLSIPCHPQLSDDEVARVIEAIHAFR